MSSRKKTARQGLTPELIMLWETINPMVLPEESRAQFQARVNAITLYAQHESAANIFRQTGIGRQELDRFVKRTLITIPDGTKAGFRGVIPHGQIFSSRKSDISKLKSRKPKPGVLAAVFAKYPAIYLAMKTAAVDGVREGIKVKEPDMAIAVLHEYFIQQCEKAGIQSPQYPFVESSDEPAGLPAIRRWAMKIRTDNALKRMRQSGNEDEIRAARGQGPEITSLRPAGRFYKRLEFDGHKIDVPMVIDIPSPRGEGTVRLKIERIWIIAGIEVRSDTLIGYSLAMGTNYSSRDLVRAVQNCLKPWQRRNLTVTTVDYGPGDGIPSGMIDELTYACFDEIALDNAMAHRADYFLSYLERTTQSVPIWSPVAAPNTHPYVEGFFNLLEEIGIHRMPTTHGSHPRDRRRKKNVDDYYHLSYELLADLIDLLVCRINGSKAPGCSQSRLEILQEAVRRRTFVIRQVPSDQRVRLMAFDICEEGTIGRDHGRPVIRFEGARYHNKTLRLAMNLIGRTVTIFANSCNLQTIEASLDDGTLLGVMQCEPRWASTPHSLETRREITREANKGHFVVCGDNIVVGFKKHLEKTAPTLKRAARSLARLQKEHATQSELDGDDEMLQDTGQAISSNDDFPLDEGDFELSAEELASLTTVYRR